MQFEYEEKIMKTELNDMAIKVRQTLKIFFQSWEHGTYEELAIQLQLKHEWVKVKSGGLSTSKMTTEVLYKVTQANKVEMLFIQKAVTSKYSQFVPQDVTLFANIVNQFKSNSGYDIGGIGLIGCEVTNVMQRALEKSTSVQFYSVMK